MPQGAGVSTALRRQFRTGRGQRQHHRVFTAGLSGNGPERRRRRGDGDHLQLRPFAQLPGQIDIFLRRGNQQHISRGGRISFSGIIEDQILQFRREIALCLQSQ